MPRPISFIKAFKHYLLSELELTIEIYSNNGFILLLRKQAQQYWISFQSVISWLSGVTSSKVFIPLEDSAGTPVSTGLVLQWQIWSCDTPVCWFSPALCLPIKHYLLWAWSDAHPLLPQALSPLLPSYTEIFMQRGVLGFKTSCEDKLSQNCPCILLII